METVTYFYLAYVDYYKFLQCSYFNCWPLCSRVRRLFPGPRRASHLYVRSDPQHCVCRTPSGHDSLVRRKGRSLHAQGQLQGRHDVSGTIALQVILN